MKRIRQELRRQVWTLLALCSILWLALWWSGRDRPERLLELPLAAAYGAPAIHDGQILWTTSRARPQVSKLLVHILPVTGGRSQERAISLPPNTIVGNVTV